MLAVVTFANMVYWRWVHADKIRTGEFRAESYSLAEGKPLSEEEIPS